VCLFVFVLFVFFRCVFLLFPLFLCFSATKGNWSSVTKTARASRQFDGSMGSSEITNRIIAAGFVSAHHARRRFGAGAGGTSAAHRQQ
jgi:ABC-type sulfate transport system permease component